MVQLPLLQLELNPVAALFHLQLLPPLYNGASMTLIGYIPAYDTYDIAIALLVKSVLAPDQHVT